MWDIQTDFTGKNDQRHHGYTELKKTALPD